MGGGYQVKVNKRGRVSGLTDSASKRGDRQAPYIKRIDITDDKQQRVAPIKPANEKGLPSRPCEGTYKTSRGREGSIGGGNMRGSPLQKRRNAFGEVKGPSPDLECYT